MIKGPEGEILEVVCVKVTFLAVIKEKQVTKKRKIPECFLSQYMMLQKGASYQL